MRFLRPLLFLLTLVAFPAYAAPPDILPDGGHGAVTEVMDGDGFKMKGVAEDIRMLGIQAPKLPKGRRNFQPWPESADAQRALDALVKGHAVTLRLGQTPKDRNGRTLAHVVRDDGLWIQQELVRAGWARVYTFPDNRQFADDLYKAEREARAAKRGIWADKVYAVRAADPQSLERDIGTFQIVEGKVAKAAKVRGRYYINFGDDYRSDFTATIAPEAATLFARAKLDPLTLEGKTIRVRGYLRDYRGPQIELSHPEQIELN
jgi:micrococcal nuclease